MMIILIFYKPKDIRRQCNPTVDLTKAHPTNEKKLWGITLTKAIVLPKIGMD